MMSNEKFPLICVVGPTASGKTGLAAALAQRLDGEVVSADSMQIYQGMSIGTAKPAVEEMRGIPHHMIDFLSPKERFSVADYAAMARKAILDIHKREGSQYWQEAPACMCRQSQRGSFFRRNQKTRKSGAVWSGGQKRKALRIYFGSCRRSIRRRRSELTGTMKNECSERLRFTISQEKP